jgi:hypothetical protein
MIFLALKDNYTFELFYETSHTSKANFASTIYYPHIVYLNSDEMREYSELSIKLAKLYVDDSERFKNDEMLIALLLKRKTHHT